MTLPSFPIPGEVTLYHSLPHSHLTSSGPRSNIEPIPSLIPVNALPVGKSIKRPDHPLLIVCPTAARNSNSLRRSIRDSR